MRLRYAECVLAAALGGMVPCGAEPMNSELDQLMSKKDWRAVEVARKSGPPIVADVEPYLRHRDAVIRLLAVDCLNAAGGGSVPQLLINALRDLNEQVWINAINALHEHLPKGQERALLAVWEADRTPDGFVRQQIPMILGRMQARETIPELHHRLRAERRQDIKDGLIAGLAKMGDDQALAEFGKMLSDARGKRTAELIEYVKYLDDPRVIPHLIPVLERRDIAVDLSTHRKSLQRRECDLAVDEVLRISKAKFGFQLDEIAQYTDAQISEVLQYAKAQAR
jgi:hypothetical protein